MFGVDWSELFAFNQPLLEILIRGSLMYLSLFLMLRFILKREAGSIALTDLLVVVLIADASQNAMAGSYKSIPEGLVLVATIIFWSWALNWLGYHFKPIQRLVHPPPLRLIKEGEMLHRNMKQELVTEKELWSLLRQKGVGDLSEVREAFMEGDGKFSVVLYDDTD